MKHCFNLYLYELRIFVSPHPAPLITQFIRFRSVNQRRLNNASTPHFDLIKKIMTQSDIRSVHDIIRNDFIISSHCYDEFSRYLFRILLTGLRISVSLQDDATKGTTRAIAEPVCKIFKRLSNIKWNGKTLQNVYGLIFGSEIQQNRTCINSNYFVHVSLSFLEKKEIGNMF